jgi:hypothetical protein
MTQDEAIRVLRDALAHAESVYRLNVVKDGEPSSTLENMQAALRATATLTPSPAQAQPSTGQASEHNKQFTPMEARGTLVDRGRSGGFDVRDCPEPENLAAFIATSCNAAAATTRTAGSATPAAALALAIPTDDQIEELARKYFAVFTPTPCKRKGAQEPLLTARWPDVFDFSAALCRYSATPSAAVAEGVDATLPKPFGVIDTYHDNATVTCQDGYTAEQMTTYGAQQLEAGRLDRAEEVRKLSEDLAWHKAAHDAVGGKLKAVWQGIRDAVEKYSGKPCEGEPFDRLDELLSALATQPAEGLTYRAALSELVEWVSDNCEWNSIPTALAKARAILTPQAKKGSAA